MTLASGHSAGATHYPLQRTGVLCLPPPGSGTSPNDPHWWLSGVSAWVVYWSQKPDPARKEKKDSKKLTGCRWLSRLVFPWSRWEIPDEPPNVMPKSWNLPLTTREPISDAKQESFYYQAGAGAPTGSDAAAIGRSPKLWVSLLI